MLTVSCICRADGTLLQCSHVRHWTRALPHRYLSTVELGLSSWVFTLLLDGVQCCTWVDSVRVEVLQLSTLGMYAVCKPSFHVVKYLD